jgi:hypothetical protein
MISRTRMTEFVRRFAWQDVAKGLDENPKLAGYRDERGRNWLHLCCSVSVPDHPELEASDSIALASLLLERGFDIDAPAFTEGEWQATPLWFAIGRGRNLGLARFLLKRGCDPNHSLWAAAFASDLEAIRLLVGHGADIDPWQEDATPFLAAIKWSRFDAAEVLLDLGADVDVRDRAGMTALHYMLKKDSDKKHFRMIVAHGARGDIPDARGATTAEIMSRKRDPEFRQMAARLKRKT